MRHIGLRENLVQRQVKARHTRTHPGAHRAHAGLLHQALLKTLGDLLIGREGRAFGQPDVHQNLGPARIRKELLLHPAHADNAQRKNQHRHTDGGPAVLHAPVHAAPEDVVKRGIEMLFMHRSAWRHQLGLEQHSAQVRHKKDRGKPAQHQRNHSHGKDGVGVLTGDRLGQPDGQKAGRRDQRARQHGHGGDFVGKGGGANLVVALLHFAHHHFNRNDGVVHQQTQRNDQRSQRNLVQADVPIIHRQKGHRQHQRNGDAHHQARPHVHVVTPP